MDTPSAELPKPYIKGFRFTVRQHTPPDPTKFDPVDRCLKNPPLPDTKGPCTVELEVLDLLRVKDGSNAQVFSVRLLRCQPNAEHFQQSKKLVAKIYDPLYFNDDEGYINPFRCVDAHYTHEVRAYNVLSELQGTLIPRFHGSCSLDIPVGGSGIRTVRLILIEHIPGLSMQQVEPSHFSRLTRQLIIKSVIDFESLVYEKDILLTDLSPRNVMIVESDHNLIPKLVFFDFAGALFGRRRDDSLLRDSDMFLGQYISPLLRWNKTMAMEFNGWIDWELMPWIEAEYAHTASKITPEMREAFCD